MGARGDDDQALTCFLGHKLLPGASLRTTPGSFNAQRLRVATIGGTSEQIAEGRMYRTEFGFEFYSDIPDLDETLRAEAENRLWALTRGHDDLVGASVTLDELTGETTPHRYEATVVVFKRPDNVVATEKAGTVQAALKGALAAAERQIRELRDKLRETWT
jgi:ribosome-associated translation inhibitor RaiA